MIEPLAAVQPFTVARQPAARQFSATPLPRASAAFVAAKDKQARLQARREDFLSRYTAKFSNDRLTAHSLRLCVAYQMLWENIDSLCNILAVTRVEGTKAVTRRLRSLAGAYTRNTVAFGKLSARQVDYQAHVAGQIEERISDGMNRLCKAAPQLAGLSGDMAYLFASYLVCRAVYAAIECYALNVDTELGECGIRHVRMSVVPQEVIDTEAEFKKLEAVFPAEADDELQPLWDDFAGNLTDIIFRLGLFVNPVNGHLGLFDAAPERTSAPSDTPLPGKGEWILICWRGALASKHIPGDTLRVVRASRDRHGNVLAVTDSGLVSSKTYDWEIIPAGETEAAVAAAV